MRFLCNHTLTPNTVTTEQVRQISEAMQHDPQVHGLHSYGNLTEGKIACIVEAPDKHTLATWFQNMHMPFDSIVPLEFEDDHGVVHEESSTHTMA